DLKRMGVVLKRAKYFITVNGKYYGGRVKEDELREYFILQSGGQQIDLFAQTDERFLGQPQLRIE
ncbi:MAG: hypothetical protein J6X24_06930, partial [Firmicutes bacterium]|nr:hypothetical protein [Bacillota bacterium]